MKSVKVLKFLLPFALWCFLYRGFLWGSYSVSEDTFAIYAVAKYFWTHMVMGIFPFWNPYVLWGMGHMVQFGEYNPVWLLIPVLNALGTGFYHAFLWTVVIYFFTGCWGAYLLFKMVVQDKRWAYLGFIFFLFSAIGMTIFTQVTTLLLFIPVVWFFYFLVRFLQTPSIGCALAISVALMLIATTYIPFYFATAMLCLTALFIVIYPCQVKSSINQTIHFAGRHKQVVLLCLAAVLLACAAAFLNWKHLSSNFIVGARPSSLSYAMIKDSGIPLSEVLRDPSLFSMFFYSLHNHMLNYAREIFSLDHIAYDDQRIFYIPVVAHALLLVSIIVPLNKRIFFLVLSCFALFLIAVVKLTPVYHVLFNVLPYLHFFRNIFLFIPFIIIAYLMLMLEQMRSLLLITRDRNYFLLAWSVLILGAFLWFWYPSVGTLKTTWISAGGLLFLLILRFSGILKSQNILWWIILVCLAVIQPIEVLSAHARQFESVKAPIIADSLKCPLSKPIFNYLRPGMDEQDYAHMPANDLYRLYNWYWIAMKDSPGFITFNYGYAAQWSHDLAKFPPIISGLDEYVRHKFAVYDPAQRPKDDESLEEFARQFPKIPKRFIEGAGSELSVVRFHANEVVLKTNFTSPQFLVYNDSFHPHWKAYVNGRPIVVHRSNFAFKGVEVPSGEAKVRFIFEPLGGNLFNLMTLLFFYVYAAMTFGYLMVEQRGVRL